VLVLGDRSGLTPECTTGETRDSADLRLPGVQSELARAVLAVGKPVALVLLLVALLLALVGGAAQWLLRTEAGTRWLLAHKPENPIYALLADELLEFLPSPMAERLLREFGEDN